MTTASPRWGIDTTGWSRLALLHLRTSRRRLVAWPLLIGFLVWTTADAVPRLYGDAQARAGYQATAGESAATRVFNGRGYGLDTVGGITAYELGFYTVLVFPVVALHLAIHLTRTQEAAGRLELLAASRLGRTAPLVAAMAVLVVVLAVAAALSGAGLAVAGLDAGSGWYAAALFLQLVAMAGLGLVVAQVATDGQGAHGLGLLVVGVLSLARGVVDAVDAGPVWLSPLGWFAEVRPYADPQAWPLAAYAVLTLALLALASVVNVRRDLGSGLVEPRPGPPTGAARLGTPVGLSSRLLRGVWVGWTVGAVVWAGVLGAIAPEMRELVESTPDMAAMLGAEGADPEDLMISLGAFFVALLALGFVAHAVSRLAGEESSGRLGVVLSAPVSRADWWLGSVAVALLGACVLLLTSGVALGAGLWVGTGDAASLGSGLRPVAVFLTALLLAGAVSVTLVAASPRLAGGAWAVFALVMTVEFLGPALDLPGWAMAVSPFDHVGRPPIDPVQTTDVVAMGVLALAVVAVSVVLHRRRDLSR